LQPELLSFVNTLPVSLVRHDIVDAQLLTNLLDTQVERVRFKLLFCHAGLDVGGQAHQTCRLVLRCLTPAILLLTTLRAINSRIEGSIDLVGCVMS
jgi:hypothetical protein